MNRRHDTSLKGTLTLILGGARSGKSQFGQSLAQAVGGDDVLFVATAEALDREMTTRITLHQSTRPSTWRTLEQPLEVGKAISGLPSLPAVVLLDCLTLLVSNVLLSGDQGESRGEVDSGAEPMDKAEAAMRVEVGELIRIAEQQTLHLIIVSGEVGMGLVPEHATSRLFRDLLGRSNQMCAAVATSTYFMVAGLPVNVAAMATSVERAANELRMIESKVPKR